jgi:hypothetical protein
MGIGIGGEGAFGMGIGASPQQPIFIPPSIGMPASIPTMGAGFATPALLMPVIGRPASIAPIDPDLSG